jgi:hypothetical protein
VNIQTDTKLGGEKRIELMLHVAAALGNETDLRKSLNAAATVFACDQDVQIPGLALARLHHPADGKRTELQDGPGDRCPMQGSANYLQGVCEDEMLDGSRPVCPAGRCHDGRIKA